MNFIEGNLLAEGQRIGIVTARFNDFITAKLLEGAQDATAARRRIWMWPACRGRSRFRWRPRRWP